MITDFYNTTENGFDLAGSVEYTGGHLEVKPVKGNERIMDSVMKSKVLVDGQKIGAEQNTLAWFDGLEDMYQGSYFRAVRR